MSIISKIALFIYCRSNNIKEPFTSYWMKSTHKFVILLWRIALQICGFSITIKGEQVSAIEAPTLIAAPHSTFFDFFIGFGCGNPNSVVIAEEYTNVPIIGSVFQLFQPIYVKRDNPHAREIVKKEILSRASSAKKGWSQITFAPEGMCSNRKSLLPYKLGPFYPGKPIQQFVMRYPNTIDTVTWTWDQHHGAISVMLLTLAQPITKFEIEWLPVYHPSPAEKEDPKHYASNMRKLVAAHCNIPTFDITFEEVKKRYVKHTRKNIKISHKDG